MLPFDPTPFTNANGTASIYTPTNIQPPEEGWQWVHPHMMVDMTCRRKRDEAGWQYNCLFRQNGWHQNGHLLSFVRRRRWVRMRKRTTSTANMLNSSDDNVYGSDKINASIDNVINNDLNKSNNLTPLRNNYNNNSTISSNSSFNSFINRTNSQFSQIQVTNPFLDYPNSNRQDQRMYDRINFKRLSRIQSACQVDRERIQLWQTWVKLNKIEILNVIKYHVRLLFFFLNENFTNIASSHMKYLV